MAKNEASQRRFDIVVAGGGIAGLTLALGLKQALGDAISVCLCDARASTDGSDQRASAIAPDGVSLLRRLGVWDGLASRTQAILAMKVVDSPKPESFRRPLLTFSHERTGDRALAHMTFHADLELALSQACRAHGVEFVSQGVRDYAMSRDCALPRLDTGEIVRCRLLVAADGARSKLRSQARIATIGRSYGQTAIVATLAHDKDHAATAYENFFPSGVFATLPLPGRRSSIVWAERTDEAQRLMRSEPAAFLKALRERLGPRLGDISLVGAPRAFPLNLQLARSFVSERLALIGDAAHVIHPLAGQGLNLGLRDAAALTQAVTEQARLGLDPAAPAALRAYERRRRPDALATAALTDGLDRLFSNASTVLRAIRDFGLGIVERQPALKQGLIAAAALGQFDAATPAFARKPTHG